ncbi:L-amino acid N-acyltransferase YncA [Pseudosulfitobacter pseudonitzschiae]|uniref:Acetyltransferase n=1 Tax=Pseudosulfitobacter pseudonitzschiae TaxID=1402135 RepID=A0A073J5X6_9RHOB|nr:GNAT family N-acetyltransferase [Pseudosulfitobacter pseudonitzschiae]KEJ97091.1 acetyltransferase [Pseudosulfitobacter pseudonitzschiae]QKS06996.1 N-acetyltransferase [Pseudosulfitobacter pseudonitzschiae]SHF51076.1 L-amino acid N-acyltransferase YncA [Pseudosulfitobacter pseudonitzschiae]
MIRVRRATALDASSMADLLNAIIEKGGTTALTRPVTARDIKDWMAVDPDRSAWQVAVDDSETVVGFQWIAPHAKLPPEACDIASFVQIGRTGLGIGSALFDATRKAAARLGYGWINATIRADNEGGLTYYQSRGFRDWAFDEGVTLDSGQVVNKISKRFDLK